MINLDKNVLGPLMSVFGEPVTYIPAIGIPFGISGVFDEAYHEVDLASGIGITTDMPVLGVQLSMFPAQPRQGDQITVTRLGATFVVKEVRPDGHGWAKLMLNYLSP